MASNIKSYLSTNLTLKIISCILGYSLWSLLSSSELIQSSYEVPLCFYNTSSVQLEAPETISVTLEGKRSLLKHINAQSLAIHVDGNDLCSGAQALQITHETLFLPESIKLVHYHPLPLVIQCSIKKS